MNKKEYMKPSMKVVELQHKCQLLVGSVESNGMNTKLQNEVVTTAFSRGQSASDEWEEE